MLPYSVSIVDVFPKKLPMKKQKFRRLLRFLRKELALPKADLRLALRHPQHSYDTLPMILWQYGLITLSQLDQIFDWLADSLNPEL
jgi:Protein of unknown function (DUF2949)